jgi:hypothetical protein
MLLRVITVVLALVALAFGYSYLSGRVLLLSSDIQIGGNESLLTTSV